MTKTMLIDAANPEEVRVCVLDNGKVEDFDFESASRKPLRGNIYLARVTRVEPSLQAAFVEFGGNRHGFLAFNEIHPDYYQIPISDRRAIQEADAEEARLASLLNLTGGDDEDDGGIEEIEDESRQASEPAGGADEADFPLAEEKPERTETAPAPEDGDPEADAADDEAPSEERAAFTAGEARSISTEAESADETDEPDDESEDDESESAAKPAPKADDELSKLSRGELIERYKDARRKRSRLLRNYKIQEVIKRRQILLVQAVKEERGNKGAALTTYLSLAGRYCVLMPNTARGGGISRKIPVAADRKRLRRIVDGLDVPNGMGLIIRTAGAKRTKAEIKRDYDYLVRLWENIRTLTLKSIAPCLIYEEASLIKRAIRDLYDKDISAVLVEGDDGYREAKDFMKMLMPSHSKNVQPYKEKTPLFVKYGVETQLDAMYKPTVRLKSGGYIVINQTEALVAIDVNSGKATRERNIEQTALRTNLEAAEEAARQFRLRDLAGLIVLDFIDMEEGRNNRAVEKRLKDALRHDRARIQLGRISSFGLLEMSRQRRRSGIVDGTTHQCPTCGGAGAVRSHEMAALRILRSTENEAISSRAGALEIKCALDVALYILNQKRQWLRRIETDYGVSIEVIADSAKAGDNFEIEKTGARVETEPAPSVVRADLSETITPVIEEEPVAAEAEEADEEAAARRDESNGEERGRRRRRRRRRGGRRDEGHEQPAAPEPVAARDDGDEQPEYRAEDRQGTDEERPRKRRRRGRRGGRRGRREEGAPDSAAAAGAENGEPPPDALSFGEAAAEPLAADSDQERDERAEPAFESPFVAPEPEPEREAEAEPEPALDERAAEPVKPTRRGWWNRAIGG